MPRDPLKEAQVELAWCVTLSSDAWSAKREGGRLSIGDLASGRLQTEAFGAAEGSPVWMGGPADGGPSSGMSVGA